MSTDVSVNEPSGPLIADFRYSRAGLRSAHTYLLPELTRLITRVTDRGEAIFDLGAGNGSIASEMAKLGYSVTGVELSGEGVAVAQSAYPEVTIEQGSGYDDLAAKYGTFGTVYSLEVIEHLYAPRLFLKRCGELVRPGGWLILSTPYHSYLKNLALALTGKMDDHFNALYDNGHIKFWSRRTLAAVVEEAGFTDIEFSRVGRIPPLAASMFCLARKPGA